MTPDAPPPPPGDARRLDHSLATGLAWTAAAKWATQALSWASTLIVARLLTPEDYGIIGMATVYLGLVQLVSEFGLGTALIHHRELRDDVVARMNGLSVLIGLGLFALSVAVAPLIAGFFDEASVRLVVMALAVNYAITGLQVVPNAILARDLRFRRLALVESVEALAQTVVTLVLAFLGARYWAIVFGSIAAKVVSTAMLLVWSGKPMAWPGPLGQLGQYLSFGWRVVVSRLTWYVYSNADFVVIGRLLGKTALGAYSFGWTIASIPADKISGILGRVTVPVFAEVQGDRAALARYLIRLTEALVAVVLPASVGMALVAPDFVRFALGDRWTAAILPLQLLAVHVTVRCINGLFSQALLGIGETRQAMRLGLWLVVVMPALFVLGARLGGPPGVALAWLIGHPVVTFPLLVVFMARRVSMPLRTLGAALWPPFAGTLVMAAAVMGMLAVLPAAAPSGVRLAAGTVVGAAVYPLVMWLAFGARVRALLHAVRHLRRQADAGLPPASA